MSESQTISEAFELIRQYAEREGLIPIGFRSFTVGPWTVTVNGTPDAKDNIPPYHALVEHADIVALMLLNPYGGAVGGWQKAEDEFIAAMQSALSEFPADVRS
jgi:hypothetical protein